LNLGCQCYFIFANEVKNRTVICKNCRNIFRCSVKMMKKMRWFLKLYFVHYFSNFESKFFKLFATALIAIGRHATVGQPRYWSRSAVSHIMM